MPAAVASAKSVAKRVLDVWFAGKVSVLRAVGVVDFPMPPNHNIRTTSSATIRHYYESGLTTALPIVVSAMHAGIDPSQPLKVLDFGCGAGRQLLQFTRQYPHWKMSGCDVDFDVIKFIHKAYPQVDAYTSSFDPPLKYADGTFDMLYAVSIFSHLSFDDCKLWLAELSRVLRPGGLALLTFNGLHSLRNSHRAGLRRQFTEEQLAREGKIFDVFPTPPEEIERRTKNPNFGEHQIGIPRAYGETYYSRTHVPEFFAVNGLQVVQQLEGVIDRHQDLMVLRKG
jgi:ubiquinone/menaquinone biosynthesis C-methylase UbiE